GVAVRFLGGACGLLGDSCGRPERPRRDADYALEVTGELVLVPEAGARGDLRQGEVVASLPELLRPFDAAGHDVLVRGKPGGRLELPGEVVGAEAGDRGQLPQARAGVEVVLDAFQEDFPLLLDAEVGVVLAFAADGIQGVLAPKKSA